MPSGENYVLPYKGNKNSRKNLPWPKWLKAWNVFTSVSLEEGINPMTVRHMGKHFEIVLDLQQKGQDWRLYDRCFRRAVDPILPAAVSRQVHNEL